MQTQQLLINHNNIIYSVFDENNYGLNTDDRRRLIEYYFILNRQ